jgi:hypothetical protein
MQQVSLRCAERASQQVSGAASRWRFLDVVESGVRPEGQKALSADRESLCASGVGDALEVETGRRLLGRRRSERFAFTAGFWLWLRFGRLLDFFSTFIFASHG